MPIRNWVRRLLARHSFSPRPRRCHPEVEVLEARLVPTLGSQFNISASASDTDFVEVASSASGLKVAVFDRDVGGTQAVFAQRYDASGAPLGGEFPVSDNSDDNGEADVAMDALGNFVVVWTQFRAGAQLDLRYSTFDNQGVVIKDNPLLSNSSFVDERRARVAMNAAGTWMVAFQAGAFSGYDIFARRFDLDGNQKGADIVVSAGALVSEFVRAIDCNAAGRFAIAYEVVDTDTLYLKRYQGAKLLGKHKIAASDVSDADVAMDNAGNTIVVYQQSVAGTLNIYSRRVSAGGTLAARKNIAANAALDEKDPRVAMDRVRGRFVVSYFAADIPTVREYAKTGALLATLNASDGDANPESGPAAVSFEDGVYFVAYLEFFSATDDDVRGHFGSL